MQHDVYDILIIGGGMVGASLACALRDTNLRIALIDASPIDMAEDHRLIGLTFPSYQFLNDLGIWSSLAPVAAAIEHIHVSESGRFGALRLHAKDIDLPVLGFVVPASYINTALYGTLKTQKNIDIIRPAKLRNLDVWDTGVTTTIEIAHKEKQIQGTLLIGADGTHSSVRNLLGITAEIAPYPYSALVTTTTLQRSHCNIAYERFHATGAIAMLPLTDNRVATIWTDLHTTITQLMQLNEVTFLQTLQQKFGYRLGRLLQTHSRYVYPLQRVHAKQTVYKNNLLLGNAAHTFSPLAAQGLNFALSEITQLKHLIKKQYAALHSIDWQDYLTWQQTQHQISARFSHQLPQLFVQDFFLIKIARQLGMTALDHCLPLKRLFTRRAVGSQINLAN